MMRILNLTEKSNNYTSNVYMVLGTWNTLEDLTTLIDVGNDSSVISRIENFNTGLGKKKLDQVILTHSHFDHTAILKEIKKKFNPVVYAFNPFLDGVDCVLRDGDFLRIGDEFFEVINITAHSNDSVCLYCKNQELLFAGDTFFPIEFDNLEIEMENTNAIQRLMRMKVQTVYYGHGAVKTFNQNFQCTQSKTIKTNIVL